MSIRSFIPALVLCILAACDPGSQSRLDKETFDAEQRRREPRRLKEGEIVEAVHQQGQALAERLNQQLAAASGCCGTLPQALQDSLSQLQIMVACRSLTDPLPPSLGAEERQVLDAYQYSAEQQQPLEPNVQPLGKEAFLYTTPVRPVAAGEQPCAVWSIHLPRQQVIRNM